MAKQIVVFTTEPFDLDYESLPDSILPRVRKALELFSSNPRHPSLCVKKMNGHKGIWEGRISDSYRFTFTISDGIYYLRRVGPHDIEKNP